VAAVGPDGAIHLGKRLTSVGAENEAAVAAAVESGVRWDSETILAHGTTLVINALLERRVARTALVCTEGFVDIHELATDSRPEPYCLTYRREAPLVPREMRFEVAERTAADGSILRRPTDAEFDALIAQLRRVAPEAIAIACLNSHVQPANERELRQRLELALPGVPISLSSDISQSPREYQRFTTAAANAAVSPLMRNYLSDLETGVRAAGFCGDLVVLDSNGGAQGLGVAMNFPLRTVESGPVSGALAARNLAISHGIENAVTFDMGGTTAKSCLIESGRFLSTDLYWIGGYSRGFPTQVPCIDILEVGAGGGSIAWLENDTRLRVGPRSASSTPGPACYGRGGTEPTVTDANLYCGRMPQTHLSGSLQLDSDAAARALSGIARRAGLDARRIALGTLHLAVLSMARTVRRQTLERGRDPRDYWLIASGGAGPMHACEVAREVGVRHVAIPMHPGHFSAIGMLSADLRFERTWSIGHLLESLDRRVILDAMDRIRGELAQTLSGVGASESDIRFEYSLMMRYAGQEHTVRIPAPFPAIEVPDDFRARFGAAFAQEYQRRYGHADALSRIDVVQIELVGRRALPQSRIVPSIKPLSELPASTRAWFGLDDVPVDTPVIDRATLDPGATFQGPTIVCEEGATSVIPPRSHVRVLYDRTMLVTLT